VSTHAHALTARSAPGPLPVVGPNQLPQAAALAFATGSSHSLLMVRLIYRSLLSVRLMQSGLVVKARLMAAPDGARPPMCAPSSTALARISTCCSSSTSCKVHWLYGLCKETLCAGAVFTVFQCLRATSDASRSKSGVRGFTRGFLPTIMRAFPANAAAFTAFDTTMGLLGHSAK
jgi:hypothetical protein